MVLRHHFSIMIHQEANGNHYNTYSLTFLGQGKPEVLSNFAFAIFMSSESFLLPSMKELTKERTTVACVSCKGKWIGQLSKQIVKYCTELLIFSPPAINTRLHCGRKCKPRYHIC